MAIEMKNSGIEWVGEIPVDWNVNLAFQIFQQVKNKNEGLLEKNLLSLSYGKIKRKNIDGNGGLLPESFDGYNIIEKDDIVLRLTDLQNDHTSLRVGFVPERGIITSAYLTLRNQSENLPRYLYYYLHTFDICKGFYGMGAGVRQGLNWEGLKLLKFTLPPVSKQKRIVSFLDHTCAEIDAVIEKTKATIEEYKALKQSIIAVAVTKGVRGNRPMKDSGVKSIGNIPSTFDKYRIKHIAELYGRIGFRGYTTDDLVDEGEGAITLSPSNLRDMTMNYSKLSYLTWEKYDESPEIKINNGDILMVKTGSSYGKTALVDNLPLEATINPQLIVIKNIKVSTKYLLYCFQTPYFLDQVENAVVGGTIPTMAQEKIYNFYVFVPDEQEQNEIVDFLHRECEKLDKLIAKKTALLEEMENYKKSVIYEYVTGKKQVQ